MADMRNVNNWHWVNKDCKLWANEYFKKELIGLSISKRNVTITLTSLDACTGDVDLNQRKGKLLAIYDVALKLSWKAVLPNRSTSTGYISVPEVAYDTEINDYVFNIQLNHIDTYDIKTLIRTHLIPLLRSKLSKFSNALISNHSADLVVDGSIPPITELATPELTQRKQSIALPPIKKEENKIVRTTTVNHSFEFPGASAGEIYECLLNPVWASIWTQGRSKVSKTTGSEFEFFDGNVHGVLLKTVPGKSIVQTWRLKAWPKDHFSTVTLDFIEKKDGVTVKVTQLGVPVGQEEIIKRNWVGYYWTAIKENYNRLQHLPIQKDPVMGMFETSHTIFGMALLAMMLIAFTAYLVSPLLKY